MSWPDGGAWVVAATSTNASWGVAVAALASASQARVAAVRIVGHGQEHGGPDELLRDNLATYVDVYVGGVDPLGVDDLVGVTRALARTHDLILVGTVDGLLVPLGRGNWTLADLAWTLPAPVVVVADSGPDSTNHTTLALEVLAGRGLSASVVAIGDDDFAGLPVRLAGRIPAGAADQPERFTTEAADWLDPLLHGVRGVPAAADESTADGAAAGSTPDGTVTAADPPRSAVTGKRVLIGLLGVFLVSVLVLCALTMVDPGGTTVTETRVFTQQGRPAAGRSPVPLDPARPVTPRPEPASRLPATASCPQYAGTVVATEPDARTTARVNAAWDRIERWLAAHAPSAHASLRPPAPPERIAALQARMSVAFPADLVASLGRHDGVAAADGFSLPSFYRPLPVDQIVSDWEGTCTVLANAPGGDDWWWHPAFVPFAAASDGGCLLVDQRPGGHGRVGEFYPEDGTGFERWPGSIAELLEGVALTLESGEPYLKWYRPVVNADGRLEWAIEPQGGR